MKPQRIFILFITICLCSTLSAQIQQLAKSSHSISANINLVKDELTNIKIAEQSPVQALINNIQIQLIDAELHIQYRFKESAPENYYNLNLQVFLDDKDMTPFGQEISGHIGERMKPSEGQLNVIIWKDILENHLNLQGKLNITLTAEMWGKPVLPYGISCDEVPQFTNQWMHLAGAGVGASAIGIGFILDRNSQDKYDNEYLSATSLEQAQPIYDDANKQRHTGIILKYAGAGILIADVVVYAIRAIKHKKRMKAYDEFCNPKSLTLKPDIQLDQSANSNHVGMKLSFNF